MRVPHAIVVKVSPVTSINNSNIFNLNSNDELLDFTTTGRLFHMREPRKRTAFVS